MTEAPKFIPLRVLEHEDFEAGRLAEPLRIIAADSLPKTAPPTNGADYCAREILR